MTTTGTTTDDCEARGTISPALRSRTTTARVPPHAGSGMSNAPQTTKGTEGPRVGTETTEPRKVKIDG
jgi:hypothetical protein